MTKENADALFQELREVEQTTKDIENILSILRLMVTIYRLESNDVQSFIVILDTTEENCDSKFYIVSGEHHCYEEAWYEIADCIREQYKKEK